MVDDGACALFPYWRRLFWIYFLCCFDGVWSAVTRNGSL
jgi:hypothetical protein